MKRILLPIALLSGVARARGGDEFHNGAGLAEKQAVYAYQHLDSYLDVCLTSSACQIDSADRAVLNQIRDSLERERAANPTPKFLSGRSRPDFFVIDGALKVAKTGDRIGSEIWLNTDLLYFERASEGTIESIGLPAIVSILVHELGHHHGIVDHAYLDLLCAKTSELVEARTEVSRPLSESWITGTIYAIATARPVTSMTDELIIEDDVSLVSLTPKITELIRCANGAKLRRLYMGNPHWRVLEGRNARFAMLLELEVEAKFQCAGVNPTDHLVKVLIPVERKALPQDPIWREVPPRIAVEGLRVKLEAAPKNRD